MKKILKKIFNWIFGKDVELSKHWWHRFIKISFLSLFLLITLGSFIAIISDPDRELLRKHNITVKNTLNQFTKDYNGLDYENTVPIFFKQEDNFGLLINNKVEYISEYSLGGESFCLKTPEKYLDGISKLLYNRIPKDTGKSFSAEQTLEWFTELTRKNFNEDTSRKCYLSISDEDLKNTATSLKIINYKPNVFFYLEMSLMVLIIAFFVFVIFALIYYKLMMYIVYGNKKEIN